MVTRTINQYKVDVKTMVFVDAETAKLQTTDTFFFENVGKATETEMRAAGKAQGIKCGKGYKVFGEIIASQVYEMPDEMFMQYATLRK